MSNYINLNKEKKIRQNLWFHENNLIIGFKNYKK